MANSNFKDPKDIREKLVHIAFSENEINDIDKFADTDFEKGTLGCPLISENIIAQLEGKVTDQLDVGTHTIFVAELESSKMVADKEAMTYEYYHDVLKGKSPENAPTHVQDV